MRTPATLLVLTSIALGAVAIAQDAGVRRGTAPARDAGTGHTARGSTPDAGAPAARGGADAGAARGGSGARAGGDAGAAVATGGGGDGGARSGPTTFNVPMAQRGSGAMTHFPI